MYFAFYVTICAIEKFVWVTTLVLLDIAHGDSTTYSTYAIATRKNLRVKQS